MQIKGLIRHLKVITLIWISNNIIKIQKVAKYINSRPTVPWQQTIRLYQMTNIALWMIKTRQDNHKLVAKRLSVEVVLSNHTVLIQFLIIVKTPTSRHLCKPVKITSNVIIKPEVTLQTLRENVIHSKTKILWK